MPILLPAEYTGVVQPRVLQRNSVYKRIREEDPRQGANLINLIPAGQVMAYGDYNVGFSDLQIRTDVVPRLITDHDRTTESYFQAIATLYKHVLAVAVSAETPARLDNALGFLTCLGNYSSAHKNKITYYEKSLLDEGRLKQQTGNASYFFENGIYYFLKQRQVNFQCGLNAQQLADDIARQFSRVNSEEEIPRFIDKIGKNYFQEFGEHYEKVAPYLAEAYLYLVLNNKVPWKLSQALLLNTFQLNFGREVNPKPFLKASTASFWKGVNASWVYPDIKDEEVDPTTRRELEWEQRTLDLQATIEALQASAQQLTNDNTDLRRHVRQLNNRIDILESERVPGARSTYPHQETFRSLEPWEEAAERCGLVPDYLLSHTDRVGLIVSGLKSAAARKYHLKAEMGDKVAENELKQIYADLTEIAQHFNTK